MFKFKNVFLGLVAVLSLVACDSKDKFETTDKGFQYRFVERGEGAKIDSGQIIEVLVRQYLEVKTDKIDSIYDKMESDQRQPVGIDSPSKNPISKIFMMGKVGDSLTIRIPNTGEFKNPNLPNFPEEGFVRLELRIMSAESATDFETRKKNEMVEMMAKQKTTEEAAIQKYIADNGIENAEKTDAGVYYVITEKGNGKMPEFGGELEVHYTGSLLDGSKFDSSVDRGETFKFNIGNGNVIRGWHDGMAKFSEGAKGMLLIPSDMGYGPRGSGGQIPPNSPLKFDIEVIKVNPAPAMKGMGEMKK